MICPRDGATLKTSEYEAGIQVEACPACGGIWLDRGRLEQIEETMEHDHTEELKRMPDLIAGAYQRARQRAEGDLTCPRCGIETESAEYAYCSQVVINRCPACGGVWLDSGELEALEVFYERSRMEAKGPLRLGFLLSLLKNQEG